MEIHCFAPPPSNVSMNVLTVNTQTVIVIVTTYKLSLYREKKVPSGARDIARKVSREVKRGSDFCTLVYYFATAELIRYCSTRNNELHTM